MDINDVLKQAVEMSASDIHIKVGLPPVIRRFGALIPLRDRERLTQ